MGAHPRGFTQGVRKSVVQQLRVGLSGVTVGPDGVNDPPRFQVEPPGGDRFAHWQTVGKTTLAQLATGREQLGAGRSVNRPVDTAAPQ